MRSKSRRPSSRSRWNACSPSASSQSWQINDEAATRRNLAEHEAGSGCVRSGSKGALGRI
jgi:hypothetical protein